MKLGTTCKSSGCFFLLALLANVFSIAADGQMLETLHTFNDGAVPNCSLIQASDRNFYGTAVSYMGSGTIFRMRPDGTVETVITFNGTNGSDPVGLIQANDGNLYGVTRNGGTFAAGTFYCLTTNGELRTLANFDGTNGAGPCAPLLQASDGNFYGACAGGGTNHGGGVFKATVDGSVTMLAYFEHPPCNSNSRLIEAPDGYLYGTTDCQGELGAGSVYRIRPGSALETLDSFGFDNGFQPPGLTITPNGRLYGTATTTLFCLDTNNAIDVLHRFAGILPWGGVTAANDDHLYGTTVGNQFGPNYGSIYVATTNGAVLPIYTFTGTNGFGLTTDLFQGNDGRLYGVTEGLGAGPDYLRYATIFAITLPTPETFNPPTIVQQPLSVVTTPTNLVMSAAASGAALTYQWQFYGRDIPGATNSSWRVQAGGVPFEPYSVVVSNPFGSVTSAVAAVMSPYGNYNGLFFDSTNADPAHAGCFTFSIAKNSQQKITGKIYLGGLPCQLTGSFVNNSFHSVVERSGIPRGITVDMQLVAGINSVYVTGTVTGGGWTATMNGSRSLGQNRTCPVAGSYVGSLIGASDNSNGPDYGNRLVVKITRNGAITVTGQLADDTQIYHSTDISEDGTWPLYIPLYPRNGRYGGCLLGWVTATNASNPLQGTISWTKLPKNSNYFPAGFTNQLTISSSRR